MAAALATLLCVGLALLGPLHYLVVEHSVCVEHGEAVHGQAVHDEHGHAPAAPATDGPTVSDSESPDAAHHDHCAVMSHAHDGIAVRSSEHAAFAPSLSVGVPTSIRGYASAPLRTAPKTSPPLLG